MANHHVAAQAWRLSGHSFIPAMRHLFSCPMCSGPQALRDDTTTGIYGLPDLSPKDKVAVQVGTLLAVRGSVAAMHAAAHHMPWIAETPKVSDGHPSVFKLPSWQSLATTRGYTTCDTDQCMMGAPSTKPTTLVGGFVALNDMAYKCSHEHRMWTVPWSAETYRGPHPRLRGTQWAIPT